MHHSKYFEASKRAKNILPSFKISIPIKHQTCPTSTFSSLLHFRLFLLALGSTSTSFTLSHFRLFLFFRLPNKYKLYNDINVYHYNTYTQMLRCHTCACTHIDLVSTEHVSREWSVLSVKIPFIDFYCFILRCIVTNSLLIQPKLN